MTQQTLKFPCPFSPGRLSELYWEEGYCLREIGGIAQGICQWQTPPGSRRVYRWFAEAGVPIRTLSQAARLKALRQKRIGIGIFSAEGKEAKRQVLRARYQPVLLGTKIVRNLPPGSKKAHSTAARKKAQATQATKRPADYWYEGHCAHCSAPIRRPRRKVRGKQVFCTRLCLNRHNAQAKQTQHPPQTRPCCWCGKPVTRRPFEFRRPVWFCSRPCANRYAIAQGGGHPYSEPDREKAKQARRQSAQALLAAEREQRRCHAEQTGERLLDSAQAAAYLGISESALASRVHRGQIKVALTKPRRLFALETLQRSREADQTLKKGHN